MVFCYFVSDKEVRLIENYFVNGGYLIAVCLGGWLFIYGISKLMLKTNMIKKILVSIGQASLFILCIHMGCFRIVNIIHVWVDRVNFELYKLYPLYDSNGMWYVVYVSFGILVPYVIYSFCKKIWRKSRIS